MAADEIMLGMIYTFLANFTPFTLRENARAIRYLHKHSQKRPYSRIPKSFPEIRIQLKNIFVVIPHVRKSKKLRAGNIGIIPFAERGHKDCYNRIKIK